MDDLEFTNNLISFLTRARGEMVDTADLKFAAEWRVGSSPTVPTNPLRRGL